MRDEDVLALIVQNQELRAQLAETQEQCVELAVDAGELHAELKAVRAQLARAECDRDAWQAKAEHERRTG